MTTEKITKDDDWLHCLCGNTPDMDGFYSCTPDGVEVEPTVADWDGIHYVCHGCGRIINQDTLEVVGKIDPAELWKCPGCGWASHECMCSYPCAACFAHDGVPMPSEGAGR